MRLLAVTLLAPLAVLLGFGIGQWARPSRSEKGCTEIVPSPQSMVAAIVAVDCDVVIRGWQGDRRR